MNYNSSETNDKIVLYTPPFFEINSYFEMVDLAVKYGIKNLETINALELSTPDLDFAKSLKKYADDKGIKIVCSSLGINLVGQDRKEAINAAKKYAQVAAILGSPYLHHTIALYFDKPDEVLINKDIYFQRGIEAVQELYEYCQQLGIHTIHEEQGYIFNGKDAFSKFFKSTNLNTGVVADFGNIMFVDERIEDFIPTVADRIAHVHLKDYKFFAAKPQDSKNISKNNAKLFGAETGVLDFRTSYAETKGHNLLQDAELGEGVVDFKTAFSQLKKFNYNGYFAFECPCVKMDTEFAKFENNLRFTNNCINNYL